MKVALDLRDTPGAAKRLELEAHAAGRLTHPHIVRVYDAWKRPDGHAFIVMELVEGRSLDSLLGDGMLDTGRAVRLFAQVADAIDHAHQHGVIHRDLKPQNVVVTTRDGEEQVRVLDFGIARIRGATDDEPIPTGAGTPAYISPERATGRESGEASDIYGLGLLLYEMLSGKRPFASDTPTGFKEAHAWEPPQPLANAAPHVTRALGSAVMRALKKNPQHRYQSAGEFRDTVHRAASEVRREPVAVETCDDGSVVTRRPRRAVRPALLALGATALVLSTVAAVWWAARPGTTSQSTEPRAELRLPPFARSEALLAALRPVLDGASPQWGQSFSRVRAVLAPEAGWHEQDGPCGAERYGRHRGIRELVWRTGGKWDPLVCVSFLDGELARIYFRLFRGEADGAALRKRLEEALGPPADGSSNDSDGLRGPLWDTLSGSLKLRIFTNRKNPSIVWTGIVLTDRRNQWLARQRPLELNALASRLAANSDLGPIRSALRKHGAWAWGTSWDAVRAAIPAGWELLPHDERPDVQLVRTTSQSQVYLLFLNGEFRALCIRGPSADSRPLESLAGDVLGEPTDLRWLDWRDQPRRLWARRNEQVTVAPFLGKPMVVLSDDPDRIRAALGRAHPGDKVHAR